MVKWHQNKIKKNTVFQQTYTVEKYDSSRELINDIRRKYES